MCCIISKKKPKIHANQIEQVRSVLSACLTTEIVKIKLKDRSGLSNLGTRQLNKIFDKITE
jgi:2C-methyl-D-erythritol 2,4-cyclodiphosphate synthase